MKPGKKLFRSLSLLSLLMVLSSLFAAAALADGATVYNSNCAGCHKLGTVDISGSAPDLLGKGSSVDSYYKAGVSGHKSITLTATNITELKAYINNPTTATTPLAISTTTLADGTVAASYSQTLAASGGLAPYAWSYNGTLPAGIVVTSAGLVMGTPTASGNFSFTVLVTDSKAATATQGLTLTVSSASMSTDDKTLFINNCSNCHTAFGLEKRSASQIQTAINTNVGDMGTSQLKGLTGANLDGIARALTPSTAPANDCKTCHSSITPPPDTTTGQGVYDASCAGCHSLGTYDTSGSPNLLGKGSSVDSYFKAGVSGHKSVTLTAANITALKAFIDNPTPATTALAISTATLAGGTVAVSYSQTLAASGGTTPYTWSRSSGTLPGGLTLNSTGVISGTPTAAGTFSFTVKATDSASSKASVTKDLSITIAAAGTGGNGQTVYNNNCASCHRLGTFDTSGSAPDLQGKSSSVDSYYKAGVSGHKSVTLTAANITDLKAFIDNPTPATTALAISTATLAGGTVAVSYSQTLAASGGTTPYTWSRSSGTLPGGLTLNSTGVISGTPTAAGTFSFTVKATDSASSKASVTKDLSITIAAAGTGGNGQTVYNNNCASCHRLGTFDTSGSAPDLQGKSSSVDSYYKAGVSGHKSVTLTAANITDLKAFIDNQTPATPTPSCGSCHATPPKTGSHSDHSKRSCSTCHGSGFSRTTVNTATHNNGVKNIVTTIGWNASKRTCSNSCHGKEKWSSTPTPSCGSCHATPPKTGSHSDHSKRSCSTCHGSGFSSTTVNTATHNNGVKNVVTTIGWNASKRTCSNSCHGSEKW